MAVPTFDQLIDPLLRVLAQQVDAMSVSSAGGAVAAQLGLSDEDLAVLLPNGSQTVFRNRIGWAHDRLKRATWSSCPKRGLWQLTDAGREAAASSDSLTEDQVRKLAWVGANPEKLGTKIVVAAPAVAAVRSPEEQIQDAIDQLRDSVGRDLLELIRNGTPAFFEQLVLEVLFELGYGESRKALRRLGGSGDQGIDGVIALDKLGLDRVYVQAKKWKGAVGSPEVQTFMGALKLQGAEKGVLITPGAFTKDAVAIAKKANGNLVLINGDRLAELMIEKKVGVSVETIEIPKVDKDFFADE